MLPNVEELSKPKAAHGLNMGPKWQSVWDQICDINTESSKLRY